MSPKTSIDDIKIIGFFSAKIIIGVGVIMFIPVLISLVLREWNTVIDLSIGSSLSLIAGFLLMIFCRTNKTPSSTQGLAVVAVTYVLAAILGAVPLYLSGYMGSFLDACFDAMSGFTTTGLYLMKDLDHIPYGLNLWRHILSYFGGQGIVVVALSFTVSGTTGMLKLYVGEGREERILPNVIQTARMIWIISLTYLVIGTLIFTTIELFDGLSFWRALYQGTCLFMGSWSCGGFATHSQSIIYYHNYFIEIFTVVFFTLGSLNFALHYAVWRGQRKEILRNIEIRSFIVTLSFSFLIILWGLIQMKAYPGFFISFRKAFYTLMSAHTTSGNMTIYGRQFIIEMGPLAMLGACIAMSIGACACSTGGGFKNLRLGIVFKSLVQDVRKFISPESSVITQKFHHIRDFVLDNTMVRNAMMIILLYQCTYFLGALAGMYYGYPPIESFFESISAGSNSGLTCGITSSQMPALLKVIYMIEMWVGRLEFTSILTLFGIIINSFTFKSKVKSR